MANTDGPGMEKNDYEILKLIGKGYFGKVYKVKSKTDGKEYALKCINKSSVQNKEQFLNLSAEREVLASIDHPFIVKMHAAFQTKNTLCFVMDNLDGGELFYHLREHGKFSEETVCFYAAQIVLAVEHLHKHNIMYRDLKPENILLDKDGNAVITDFGLAKLDMTKDKKTKSFCGTPEYIAPEIISGKGYDKSADWWSLGILVYEMLSGKHPYKTKNNDKMSMFRKILEKPVKMRPEFSNDARSLINGLLAVKTHNRIGCSDLGADEIKYHEFFRSINWTMLKDKKIEPPIIPKDLNEEHRYGHLKKDGSSIEELQAEFSDDVNEDFDTESPPKPNKFKKTRSSNVAPLSARRREYRYFENFEYQRSSTLKSK